MGDECKKNIDEMNRRDFLRNSAYAAAATPIVLSMIVEKASAGQSPNNVNINSNSVMAKGRTGTRVIGPKNQVPNIPDEAIEKIPDMVRGKFGRNEID